MLGLHAWIGVLSATASFASTDQAILAAGNDMANDVESATTAALPFTFKETFDILGPFQIGTREATWGADPLERDGGFRSLEYDTAATFRSSLAANATVSWSRQTAEISGPRNNRITASLTVGFSHIDWASLQQIYGWSALQWQAWARGEIIVDGDEPVTINFYSPQILEFWIDDTHYFGGDFYGFEKAPATLRLEPGIHRVDVRLVRDVRAMGGVGSPDLEMNLILEHSNGWVQPKMDAKSGALVSDFIDREEGATLAGPFGSVILRNDMISDAHVFAVEAMSNGCVAELISSEPFKLIPGLSRPLGFRVACIPGSWSTLVFSYRYRIDGKEGEFHNSFYAYPQLRKIDEPHKVTFLHPGGIVSYAILRAPSQQAINDSQDEKSLPILLLLHGAGVEAENEIVKHALDPLPDLAAWALFPTGVTPWSGDDWHVWGFSDVEASISMIRDWIAAVSWTGPDVDTSRWLVGGHSNGGQGTWYTLLHQPDKVIAAAPLSGYSSIQTYVPYTFWHPADPGRTAIIQSALSSYRHELLLPNAQGIPIFQQHGGADDNVPPYHSRFMNQLLHEAGGESTYYEIAGQPHWWDGVMTTPPLKEFYTRHIKRGAARPGFQATRFSVVSVNPGDTSSKFGLQIMQLMTPARMGRVDVEYDPLTESCTMITRNVRQLLLPAYFRECKFLHINTQSIPLSSLEAQDSSSSSSDKGWIWVNEPFPPSPLSLSTDLSTTTTFPRPIPPRRLHQLGAMDAILHSTGPFTILSPPSTSHLALQISRNLLQYFSADSTILFTSSQGSTPDNTTDSTGTGTIIRLALGASLPPTPDSRYPISVRSDSSIFITLPNNRARVYSAGIGVLGAIFTRSGGPYAPGLELVIWGADIRGLQLAARLVPMLPGVGQPDFVVVDESMAWKGIEGVRAMGFLDEQWRVSENAFFE